LLGSARNLVNEDSIPGGGSTFGFECDVALDASDAYINELLSMVMPYGVDPQMTEILRLAGSSEVKVNLEGTGEVVDSMLNPVLSLNADWFVNSRSFISALGYFDLDNILFSIPGLSSSVFQMNSTLTMIPMESFEALQSQPLLADALGKYVDELMPYLEEVVIAALNELPPPVEGKEEITLGGKNITVDTIDLEITEADMYKALIAALNVIKYSPDAQTLLINAYNEVAAEMSGSAPIDVQTLSIGIDGMIVQLNSEIEYAEYSDDVTKIRLYMYDGILSGMVFSIPSEAMQLGYALITDAGYSFWYKDLMYSEFDLIKDMPPSMNDHGVGDHSEIHGSLSSGANGLSGDLYLKLRQYDDVFDEKLMTFADLDAKVVFGIPVVTGSITVKMRDIYNAFIDKDSSSISSVWSMAYSMESLDEYPILKDLEFSLELSATNNDYQALFRVADPTRNSKATISFRGYYSDKAISPPQGPRISVDEADADVQQAILEEMMDNLENRLDELQSIGYDLTWLKPMLYQQIFGASYGDAGGIEDYELGASVDISSAEFVEGYIFENSSDDILDPEVLITMPLATLVIARNEIYARHGWVFSDIDLQIYFNQQDWYIPIYDNESIELNAIEQANVEMLKEVERYLGG